MYCLMCGKEKSTCSILDVLFGDDPLCFECRNKWKRINLKFNLDGIPVESPYLYNDDFAHCLIQYKECGDEALKKIFLYKVKNHLKIKYKNYTFCLMPSSKEKEISRGFSHLEKMFETITPNILSPFIKIDNSSQKGLSRNERLKISNKIYLKENIVLPKNILLCDDTITTGSTLRGALTNINKSKHSIKIFCCSANKSWLKSNQNSI